MLVRREDGGSNRLGSIIMGKKNEAGVGTLFRQLAGEFGTCDEDRR